MWYLYTVKFYFAKKGGNPGRVWWFMPVIPAPKRLRQGTLKYE
jgi:hypothetical protein